MGEKERRGYVWREKMKRRREKKEKRETGVSTNYEQETSISSRDNIIVLKVVSSSDRQGI